MNFPMNDTHSRSGAPRALGLTRVDITFDALKSALAPFALHDAHPTSATLSNAMVLRREGRGVDDSEYRWSTHLSGVVIAASVGIGYAYNMVSPTTLWSLPFLHWQPPFLSTSPTIPSPPGFDCDIEAILSSEALHSTVLARPTHVPHPPSFPTTFVNLLEDKPQRSRSISYSSTSDLLSLSIASTPYTSSSSIGPDSPYEPISPMIDNIVIADLGVAFSERGQPELPNLSARLSRQFGIEGGLEASVLELMKRLDEEVTRRPAQVQDFRTGAAPNSDSACLTVESREVSLDDEQASETGSAASEEELETGGYADSDDDDETPLHVIHNPHTRTMYRLSHVLGAGGFSQVVLATDLYGQEYAAKIVSKQKVFTRLDGRRNLLHEKNIMAKVSQLETPCLMPLVESWEREDEVYFILERFSCSLYDVLNPPKGAPKIVLTEHDERLLCAEMIASLSVLHQNGIVHRDIKPENFLLDAAGGIVLADFGLSIEAGLHDEIEEVCGTLDNLAPEQWQAPTYDSKADVWQLGCTFVELLAGLHDTWIGTMFGDYNPLKRADLDPRYVQSAFYQSLVELLPEDHPALPLVADMIIFNPARRPSVEDLKADPWFEGIDWDAITYGPTAPRSFTPYYVDLGDSLQSLDADSSSNLQLTPNEERTLKEQMDMCANEPHAFVYPPHSDA